MKKILIALTLLLCPLCVNASSKSEDSFDKEEKPSKCPFCSSHLPKATADVDSGDDEKSPALTVFPMRESHYTQKEFLVGFRDVVDDSLWGDFKNGWSAIYDGYAEVSKSDKPVQRLSAERETMHIQCLYKSLVSIGFSDEVCVNLQKRKIYKSFVNPTHIRLIRAKDSDLAGKIELFMSS